MAALINRTIVRNNINLTSDVARLNNIEPISAETGTLISGFRFTSYDDYTSISSGHKPYINTTSGEVVMAIDRLVPSSGTDITVGGVVISG